MKGTKRILVAPLNWGLGHATRCVPVIQAMLQKGADVWLASDGDALWLLRHTFPQLPYVELPAYNPVYPTGAAMVTRMAAQLPKFIAAINAEHHALQPVVHKHKIQVVIADNRYGCYSPKAHSIFIGHQLNILMPTGWQWAQPGVNYFNHRQLNRFNQLWVPAPDSGLFPQLMECGELPQLTYIGNLSRLKKVTAEQHYKVSAILSGPEPQRSILENLLKPMLQQLPFKTLLVRGVAASTTNTMRTEGLYNELDFAPANELEKILAATETVVARSGYSTVMDLMATGKKALFIPTPGQTEQAYIAAVLKEKGIAYSMPQNDFSLQKALKEALNYNGFVNFKPNNHLLEQALDSIF